MPKLSTFDRATTRNVSERAVALLAQLENELGITVQYKGGSFSPASCVLKLEFSVKSEDGKPTGREAESFQMFARLYKLDESLLGKPFTAGGKVHRIVGYNHKAKTMPWLVDIDGKAYKLPSHTLKFKLGLAGLLTGKENL